MSASSLFLFALALLLQLSPFAQAQTVAADTGPSTDCTFQNQVYTCNKPSFLQSLSSAKSVAVQTGTMDKVGSAQLRKLIEQMGKQQQTGGGHADLTFLLAPIGTEGVTVGPAGTDLATLRIYRTRPDGARGNLLWAETLRGQADTPWPLVVRALISQFQADVAKP